METPLLRVENLARQYTRGLLKKQVTFSLGADFTVDKPCVVGVMGPNGSGKTTLFELITGSNLPNAGRVLVNGQDIHQVKTRERDRLAIHYHQSYQVRSFQRSKPNFMLDHSSSGSPLVHFFDEPQFNTQDGYIGFMLEFFKTLRARGRLVFLCLHPNEPYHLDILRESCERFIFCRRVWSRRRMNLNRWCRMSWCGGIWGRWCLEPVARGRSLPATSMLRPTDAGLRKVACVHARPRRA